MPLPDACTGCSASWSALGFVPPAPPSGRPRLVVWGEAPGDDAVHVGRGFVGRSGRRLRGILRGAGLDPGWVEREGYREGEVCYRNVVLCRRPGNSFPDDEVATDCLRRHQADFVAQDDHPWLVAGANAVQALLDTPGTPILRLRGSVLPRRSGPSWGTATIHPAFLLHGKEEAEKSQVHLTPLLVQDAARAVARRSRA